LNRVFGIKFFFWHPGVEFRRLCFAFFFKSRLASPVAFLSDFLALISGLRWTLHACIPEILPFLFSLAVFLVLHFFFHASPWAFNSLTNRAPFLNNSLIFLRFNQARVSSFCAHFLCAPSACKKLSLVCGVGSFLREFYTAVPCDSCFVAPTLCPPPIRLGI